MYKILIVDDERNERVGIEKLILRYQYDLEIKQAANGEEALSILEKEPIDILLTDIKMPFMNGIELIKQVHNRGLSPICIIYSAYGEFEYAQNAISLGVLQYLLKPVKLDEFQQLFEKVMEICEEKKQRNAEKEKLKQKLKKAEDVTLSRKLLNWLESESTDYSYEVENLIEADTYIPIILSSYSSLFSRYWENYERDIHNIVGEEALIINKNDTQMVLLIQNRHFTEKQVAKMCEEIIGTSKGKYQSEVFIVVGNECKGMNGLKKEYEKIQEQLDYQFFISESTFFIYDESGIVKKKSEMLPIHFEKIMTFAKLEDLQGMKQEFKKAFEYVEKNTGFSSIYIKYNFSEVIKRCCEILHSEEKMLQVVEEIYGSHSMNQVKESIFDLIEVLARNRTEKLDENRIVALAKNIIHERYSDCTLNVSSIADELGISAAYMSTLFKMDADQNLVKYISKYRIEKAKELLKTTNMKIGNIAEKVGYLNTSYFISLFRNNVGCSPAKYREKLFKNE